MQSLLWKIKRHLPSSQTLGVSIVVACQSISIFFQRSSGARWLVFWYVTLQLNSSIPRREFPRFIDACQFCNVERFSRIMRYAHKKLYFKILLQIIRKTNNIEYCGARKSLRSAGKTKFQPQNQNHQEALFSLWQKVQNISVLCRTENKRLSLIYRKGHRKPLQHELIVCIQTNKPQPWGPKSQSNTLVYCGWTINNTLRNQYTLECSSNTDLLYASNVLTPKIYTLHIFRTYSLQNFMRRIN